ncbi:DHH family phosphoesterase [Vibrio algivorus]|uniref:DHH family phosphoesterase n=1 Tax=Vibrio algivorus TaxID=1667024 RepID=A0A557P5M1_9VIBR|nr:DHH family phosphoesterase [Vibrio algivorus]TVO35962.1 DHH family phosphoesterase [Vibrio algivorus]
MHYDVFNGDADGIIALLQLRLFTPRKSKLITGVKRDIKLLQQVDSQDDVTSVTVLDISMEKNITALNSLLEKGIPVFYSDHHRCGDVPNSAHLSTKINLDAEVCTSLLVNELLEGKYAHWAIAGAFGDNLDKPAREMAKALELSNEATDYLKELGTLINYNGYGASLEDLHIAPAELYRQLLTFPNPFELVDISDSPFYQLKEGYERDYFNVESLQPIYMNDVCEVYQLPCEPWARRTSGVFGNELANKNPDKAHAVLTLNESGTDYTVSVRAPLNNRIGADEICCQFPTGGGRKVAAGINQLPFNEVDRFIEVLEGFYA